MEDLSENVRQGLITLLPASMINDITCFVLYDKHPRDDKNIDIIICTKEGSIKEYYQRELVCSISIESNKSPSQIHLMRSSKCKLFYIVEVGDEVYLFARRQDLKFLKKITNVQTFDINDSTCRGAACLKVLRKDDAVPIIFDDNLDCLGDQALFLDRFNSYDAIPLAKDLMKKLIEVRFGVKANEKAYKDLLNLRQTSAFSTYERINPSIVGSVYNVKNEPEGALKIKTTDPWVKVCNKKMIVVIEVLNKENITLQDVHILLHRTVKSSVNYTTKLYTPTNDPLYWIENNSRIINGNSDAAVVAVINMKELKHNTSCKLEFNGVICYKDQEKEHLVSFGDLLIPANDVMGQEFDVLSNMAGGNEKLTLLALLATTDRIDLCFRVLKSEDQQSLDLKNSFCEYLLMQNLGDANNVLVHRVSPYHVLFGVMVVFPQIVSPNEFCFKLAIYVRSPSQLLALINIVQDAIPYRIVITDTNKKITALKKEFNEYNEPIIFNNQAPNITKYSEIIANQTALTLEYFDKCMFKMHESKKTEVQSKLGTEIDIFANGVKSFQEYRKKMLEEAAKGTEFIKVQHTGLEGMHVDSN